MNIFIPLLTLLLSFSTLGPETPQTDHTQQIATMIKNGDATQLSNYFTGIIDLTVMDKEDMYSRAQAKLIIADFFDKHKPTSLEFVHKGILQNGREYRIGNMKTTDGNFRITFYMKPVGDNFRIYQMNISEE